MSSAAVCDISCPVNDVARVAIQGLNVETKIWIKPSALYGEDLTIHALVRNTDELIASVNFVPSDARLHETLYWYCPGGVVVDDEYARKGIGTAMYVRAAAFLRTHGREGRIRPSRILTLPGFKFWVSLRSRFPEVFDIPDDFDSWPVVGQRR